MLCCVIDCPMASLIQMALNILIMFLNVIFVFLLSIANLWCDEVLNVLVLFRLQRRLDIIKLHSTAILTKYAQKITYFNG